MRLVGIFLSVIGLFICVSLWCFHTNIERSSILFPSTMMWLLGSFTFGIGIVIMLVSRLIRR
jgi:hypothetical protein